MRLDLDKVGRCVEVLLENEDIWEIFFGLNFMLSDLIVIWLVCSRLVVFKFIG